jgi:hypothetical protein
MAPEDQLACTETLYFSSWVGDRRTDRRIAGRYTRMMVHEAFKAARMDRPGDTAIDSSRASENWRWRDSPRAWSPCHFSKKESTRTRLPPLEESRRLATTWEVNRLNAARRAPPPDWMCGTAIPATAFASVRGLPPARHTGFVNLMAPLVATSRTMPQHPYPPRSARG